MTYRKKPGGRTNDINHERRTNERTHRHSERTNIITN